MRTYHTSDNVCLLIGLDLDISIRSSLDRKSILIVRSVKVDSSVNLTFSNSEDCTEMLVLWNLRLSKEKVFLLSCRSASKEF